MANTVLLVEDDLKLRNLLRTFLEEAGLTVLSTGSGVDAIVLGARSQPDLVILDLGLPDVTGYDVARELRRTTDVPIVMLTARADEEDRIRGLELGADDYVTKPFSPRELVLRVHALLRRGRDVSAATTRHEFGGGALVIDEQRHEILYRGAPVQMSPTEWGIIETMARSPGRVYSRYELINAVRGHEWEGYERVVDSHIKNIRRKLGADGSTAPVIETVLGVGYRLSLHRDD